MVPETLYPGDNEVKTFTIPVSGSVVLYGPEVRIVQTREFQRLAGIKQLGTSYVVFRGAMHTRYEHSLGTLHRAEQMMQAITNNPRSPATVPVEARRIARLAALLHDVPHIPFGHTLEDELHLLEPHDMNAERRRVLLEDSDIGDILRGALGEDYELLLDVLGAHEDEEFSRLAYPYVGDIVGNTVCADLLDYVERDLAACGLPVGMGDRFLDYLTITGATETRHADRCRLALNLDKRGMPRPDVESEVLKLLSFRYELAERVYFHHAKNAASVMLGRAVLEAGLAHGAKDEATRDENFHWLSDETLLQSLAHPEIAKALGVESVDATTEGIALASRLAEGILDRRLFKIAYLGVADDLAGRVPAICEEYHAPGARRDLEDELADKAGLPHGSVLVHLPRQKMMRKLAGVRVRTSMDDIITMSEWDEMHSRRVEALNHAHARLWRATVYVHPEHAASAGLVRVAAEDEFKAPSRYVEKNLPAYLRAVFDQHADARGWHVGDLAAFESVAAYTTADTLAGTLDWMNEAIEAHRATKD